MPPVPQHLERRDLFELIAAAALVAALIAWVPWLKPLAYPFRLLLTLVHELSHGLAALATGGAFRRLVVFADGSGIAHTAGGWRIVVIPAGYLGAAAFGAGLILLGPRPRSSRWALGAIGALLAVLSLRYGLPSLLSSQALGGLLAIATGVTLGALGVLLALRAGTRWIVFALHFLAIQSALAALSDLWALIGFSTPGSGPATDARSMAAVAFLPPLFWALLWALFAAVLVGGAVRLTWFSRRDSVEILRPPAGGRRGGPARQDGARPRASRP